MNNAEKYQLSEIQRQVWLIFLSLQLSAGLDNTMSRIPGYVSLVLKARTKQHRVTTLYVRHVRILTLQLLELELHQNRTVLSVSRKKRFSKFFICNTRGDQQMH